MSLFPDYEIVEISTEGKTVEFKDKKEPLYDFILKKIVLRDGRVVYSTYAEKIKQWVELILRTELDKFQVYKGTNFGFSRLYEYRGHNLFTSTFGVSELKREIKEKIEIHSEISLVKDIKIDENFNTVRIEMTLVLISGEVLAQEVLM